MNRSRQVIGKLGWTEVSVALILVLGLVVMHWAFLEEMDALAFDFALRLRGPQAPDSRIVIVGVDEASLDAVGAWPWPPETISRLLENIASADPLAIGIDLILSHSVTDYPALEKLNRTVVASALGSGAGVAFGELRWEELRLSDKTGGISLGHIHAGKDADGVCRSLPLVLRAAGKVRWAFAVELARVVVASPPESVRFQDDHLLIGERISVPRLTVPIDRAVDSAGILSNFAGDHMLINPRGNTYSFPHFPAAEILAGDRSMLESLKGRIVLIGATAYSLGDHLSTPFTGPSEMPGIEIHANALDTILNQRFLNALVEPWLTLFLIFLALGSWSILAAWPRARTLPMFLLLVGASAAGPLLLFLAANYWIPLVSTTAVVLVSGTTSQFLNYSRLNRQLNQRYHELSSLLAESRPGLQSIATDSSYPGRSLEWKLHLIGEASETALRLSKERSEMTSFVSHELKTPLTSIQGFAELLQEPGLLSEEDRMEAARTIRAESIRLSTMVTDFLRLTRLEHQAIRVRTETVRLVETLERAQGFLESQLHSRRMELLGMQDLPDIEIQGDRELLTQVFLNLLGNAVKFSPQGSSIEVAARIGDGRCSVMISDRGNGIPEEDLPRLFQKFFRGRADADDTVAGSGLGLAFVKEVIHQHGGSVEVSSELGVGSVFTVRLPFTAPGSIE